MAEMLTRDTAKGQRSTAIMADALTSPIPISYIQGRYLLFDIDAIIYLRRHYHICGVYVGTLAQNPSQNVFLGLPMEIMPEEAQVLIDEAVCYVLDDAQAHDAALAKANRDRQLQYVEQHKSRAAELAEEKAREKEYEKRKAIKRVKAKQWAESMGSSTETVTANITTSGDGPHRDADSATPNNLADSLFTSPSQHCNDGQVLPANVALSITPTSSTTLLPSQPTNPARRIPNLHIPSYTLYKHLNSKSYFQTPGLRFGCQFCVYPGDPLRFHSHFLAVGYRWDEEVDLMDVVGGGRLGTGVKKGWLIGGKEPGREGDGAKVRTWSVEWAGM